MSAGEIRLTIKGVAQSKANSREFARFGDKVGSRKSDAALEFEAGALLQIPIACRLEWTCDVAVTMNIFYPSRRSDLDESIVLDVLQTRYKTKFKERYVVQRGVYVNDRQIMEKHIFKHLDPANPRVEIIVRRLDAIDQPEMFGADELQPVGRPSDKSLAVAQAAVEASLRRPRAAMEERKADVPPAEDGQPF